MRIAEVGSAKHATPEGGHRAAFAPSADEADNRLSAILRCDAIVFSLDDVKGFVPADLLPGISVASLFWIALHRMQDARRIIDVVFKRNAAGAEPSLRDRVVFVAFDFNEPTVFVRIALQSASHGMAAGGRPRAGPRYGKAIFFKLPRLVEVVVRLADSVFAAGI